MSKQPPCYGCEDRQVGCHGKCERYSAWNAAHTAEREEIQKKKDFDSRHREQVFDRVRKMSNRKKGK